MRRDQKHNALTVDPLDLALKERVWTGGEKGVWMGMQCAAIAQTSGAEAMVLRVDSAMRDMAKDGTVFATAGPSVAGVKGFEGIAGENTDGLGGQTGQAQAQAVNAPNKPQAQRSQTKSPVLQKQTQKKAQGGLPTQQQRTQALNEAQHRAQFQAQQIARQKEMHRQAQVQARQGQGQQRPNPNPNGGNKNSGKQDAIVID